MDVMQEFLTVRPAEWEILVEVVIAMALGGLVGFERETASKPVGVRTHMLVSGSAALLVGLSFALVEHTTGMGWSGRVTTDPVRVLQAIVLGVSFLGAGTIFRGHQPKDIRGLTTAASLLMSSGVGVAVALRYVVLAALLAGLVAVVLRVIGNLEGHGGKNG